VIPTEARVAMEGVIPSYLSTCAADGMPNVSYISQVFYVDERHVAVSFQFFSKTTRNLAENPFAHLIAVDARSYTFWLIDARFDHAETSGPLFEQMEMQLEAIASTSGMSDVFRLKAAHVYEVLAIERTALFSDEEVAAITRR
jgi:hypothetical protein